MFVSFVVITSLLQAYLLWSLTTMDILPETCGFALQILEFMSRIWILLHPWNFKFTHAYSLFTHRIAWAALGYRLHTPDVEAFSKEMKMSAVSSALAKRYYSPHARAGKLQVREEEPGSLQVRRLKSFCEPGIQVA